MSALALTTSELNLPEMPSGYLVTMRICRDDRQLASGSLNARKNPIESDSSDW
jgi:hypothetical protein